MGTIHRIAMRALLLFFSLLALGLCLHDSVIENVSDFSDFQVFRALPKTREEADFLHSLRLTATHYDFWTEVQVGGVVDIMVPQEKKQELLADLEDRDIQHSLHINNVQELIEKEKIPAAPERWQMTRMAPRHSMTWTEYHSLEDMYTYLDFIEAEFDFVTTEEIGQSGEGRPMRVAKICRGECGSKPAVWIDGGIHAREWVSPAATTWVLKELVENDAAHPDLLENLDWYILPCVNPDGYLYTQTNNRLWRKTRTPNGNSGCYGTDANRNWGYHWGTGGSSSDPCSDTYMGPEAFSEIETKNVRDWLTLNKETVKFYNNVHSYSQLVLLPWGYGYDEPDNVDDLYALAEVSNDALYGTHQKTYEIGCIPCLLYVASGGSLDWTLGELGIPYSYAMELRDTGLYGFLLPPAQIIPTGEEVWAFHMTAARELIKEFVP